MTVILSNRYCFLIEFITIFIDFKSINIKPISVAPIFIVLYPMLTGMVVEKIKKAGRNFKLIIVILTLA